MYVISMTRSVELDFVDIGNVKRRNLQEGKTSKIIIIDDIK